MLEISEVLIRVVKSKGGQEIRTTKRISELPRVRINGIPMCYYSYILSLLSSFRHNLITHFSVCFVAAFVLTSSNIHQFLLSQINEEYAAVMFENKVQVHLIDNEDGQTSEERESKLFPAGL